jgi:hypothetical protein
MLFYLKKYFIFSPVKRNNHFLLPEKEVVMLDGRKDEIFFEMQEHNGMNFTKIGLHKYLLTPWSRVLPEKLKTS